MLIKEKAPENWSTLALRMCMMKAASMLAKHINADCLITGESLGQVASQTLENMKVTESMAELPLLRPLVAFHRKVQRDPFLDTLAVAVLEIQDGIEFAVFLLQAPGHTLVHSFITVI